MNAAVRLHPRTEPIELTIDGNEITAYAGETVAALLMTIGERTFTKPTVYNLPRTLYCGMGICHQCLVTVDGVRGVRACMTTVKSGMCIETQ